IELILPARQSTKRGPYASRPFAPRPRRPPPGRAPAVGPPAAPPPTPRVAFGPGGRRGAARRRRPPAPGRAGALLRGHGAPATDVASVDAHRQRAVDVVGHVDRRRRGARAVDLAAERAVQRAVEGDARGRLAAVVERLRLAAEARGPLRARRLCSAALRGARV